jgi:uncharacterized membrane protein YeaQ/YmgE (transglycosylase-associated protein family)
MYASSAAQPGDAPLRVMLHPLRRTISVRPVLILAILGLGMGVGALAQLIVGKEGPRVDWTMAFIAGFAGSLVGGLIFSLVAGDGLSIRLSGILGSLIGAIIITAVWQWYSRRKKAEARAAERAVARSGRHQQR